MEKFEIDKLRSLPIESVAERLGLRVVRHKSLCPFHDDNNPSLSFSVSRNSFKCFVCDAHGGIIDLAMKVLGRDFVETCHWLANEHNVILSEWKLAEQHSTLNTQRSTFTPEKYRRFFERPFINQAAGEFLFEKRHLDPRVVRWCRLTSYTDRNSIPWLQIPYFDIEGNLIGVQWRNLKVNGSELKVNGKDEKSINHKPSQIQVSLWKQLPHLQPACLETPQTGRRTLDSRRLLRLLEYSLQWPQSHRHSKCHLAEAQRP